LKSGKFNGILAFFNGKTDIKEHKVTVIGSDGEVKDEKIVTARKGSLLFSVKLRRGTVKVRPL
jgi:hypothetical protein